MLRACYLLNSLWSAQLRSQIYRASDGIVSKVPAKIIALLDIVDFPPDQDMSVLHSTDSGYSLFKAKAVVRISMGAPGFRYHLQFKVELHTKPHSWRAGFVVFGIPISSRP